MSPSLVTALCVVGFPAFWCAVCGLIALVGGWNKLATRFPAGPHKPAGMQMYFLESLELGASRYKGAVSVGVAPAGLYLSAIWLFRVGHKPILVPWEAITKMKTEKQFWMTATELSVPLQKFDTATITLFNTRLVAAIASHLPPSVTQNRIGYR